MKLFFAALLLSASAAAAAEADPSVRIQFKVPGGDKNALINWDGDELQISNHTAELKKLVGDVQKALGDYSIFEDHVTASLLLLNETVVSQGETLDAATQDIADLEKELTELREDAYAELTSVQEGLQAQINATKNDLANLEENVELNEENVEVNKNSIQANVQSIQSNDEDIAQNLEDIKTKGCRPGTYHDPEDVTKCLKCVAGTYSTNGGASECKGTPCASGKYYPDDGVTYPVTCLTCTPGTYASGTGNTGCEGEECGSGTWHEPGQSAAHTCKDCARGKWSADTGRATECGNCGAGRASNDEGRSTQCPQCLKGTAATSNTQCTNCGPGTYSGEDGVSGCSTCNAGSFSSGETNTKCENCAPGRWSTGSADECTRCGPGTYTKSSTASCSNCGPGKYSDGQSNSDCETCDDGDYNTQYTATECQGCTTCTASQAARVACEADTNRVCEAAWEGWTNDRKCMNTYQTVSCASAEAECQADGTTCKGYHRKQWTECTKWGGFLNLSCRKEQTKEECQLCNDAEHYYTTGPFGCCKSYHQGEYKIKKYKPNHYNWLL